MDKNAIKRFAIWARRELIERVSRKAIQYGIEKGYMIDADADSVDGRILTDTEKSQRKSLIIRIKAKGYEEVMEEAAYTWFNRLIALRFMEVNGCLPSHVRIFTNEENQFKPQILDEALHLDWEELDKDRIYELKDADRTEELYKYLLIAQCNELSDVLPGMFQKISDYTELLLPDNLLREESIIARMIFLIPAEDWMDTVQILGWLYQYYNSEKKEEVFSGLKKNKKIGKEEIPAVTQLFTPDWIVRYMAENSLGRLWLSGHPIDRKHFLEGEKKIWKYYLDDAPQDEDVKTVLKDICLQAAQLTPEKIHVIDPCCGSGHILAYAFDMLMEIYTAQGWRESDAAASIVGHNLYGLDIDLRAAQLAYFSIMMKGVQYDRRFLKRGIAPHVRAIRESNHMPESLVNFFCGEDENFRKDFLNLLSEMKDARTYGSLLKVGEHNWNHLFTRFDRLEENVFRQKEQAERRVRPFLEAAYMLSKTYDVVITNPPYMGSRNMDVSLLNFIKRFFVEGKTDLYAAFLLRCLKFAGPKRYIAMITQQAWMFLSGYQKLRNKLETCTIISMLHLGARAFDDIPGEVVQSTTFVLQKNWIKNYHGIYQRLLSGNTQQEKEKLFFDKLEQYTSCQESFKKLPGEPIAYWITSQIEKIYQMGQSLNSFATPRKGNSTSNNDRFLKLWYEVNYQAINFGCKEIVREETLKKRWFPYNKGGDYRKWFGNNLYLIDWYNDAEEIRKIKSAVIANYQYFMKPGLTWSTVSSKKFSIRWFDEGFIFDNGGCCIFELGDRRPYFIALLNSCVFKYIFCQLNPTLNFQSGEVAKFPVILQDSKIIDELSLQNVRSAKADWDSFETSWDFQRHPMIDGFASVEEGYRSWQAACETRFKRMKANEEKLNSIFISIYGLEEELISEVAEKDVTVTRIFDSKEDIPEVMKGNPYTLTKEDAVKTLLSYAVGCLFGRYSLDLPGLVYAGGEWDDSKYVICPADRDNVIPICDDEYFDDDIVGRFVKFIEVVYGKETLEENLKFIADALGGRGQPREIIRRYFLDDFYEDHCKTYQRPIYWLFDSGKKNGFKALIYMHRYQSDTLARIRTDYVHEQQSRYRTAIAELKSRIENASSVERVRLSKALNHLNSQDAELQEYEEKIHHLADQMISIDLNDGVKINYAKFKEVLAPIKLK